MSKLPLLGWLLPPGGEEPEERREAKVVVAVLVPGTVIVVVMFLLQPFLTPGGYGVMAFYGGIVLLLVAAVLAVRTGRVRVVGPIVVVSMWVLLTILAVFSEGIRSPTVVAYPVMVGAAAFFWSGAAAVLMATSSVLAVVGMALAESLGVLPEPIQPVTLGRFLGGTIVSIVLAGVVMSGTWESIRRALAEARESEAKFRDLIEGSPDGMAVLTEEGQILQVNPRLADLFGRRPEDLLGMSFPGLLTDATLADLAPPISGRLFHGSRKGEERPFPMEVSVSRVVSAGRTVRVVTLRDVTEELRREEERRLVEARLGEAQKMEAVGRLAGGVAHDFNNLLTVILGNVSLELEREDLGPDDRKRWDEVEAAAARAAELTSQLLAFSRKQVLDPTPVDLAVLVEEQGPVLQRILGSRARLEVEVKRGAWVEVDVGQMDTVLLNLVHNAREAMPQGGVLRISVRSVELAEDTPERGSLPPGSYALLTVRDSGVGMGEEVMERVFEPFFTTKGVGEGSGLGLATVHGIVSQSGGQALVESAPGSGTAFRLFFPRIPAPVRETAH